MTSTLFGLKQIRPFFAESQTDETNSMYYNEKAE